LVAGSRHVWALNAFGDDALRISGTETLSSVDLWFDGREGFEATAWSHPSPPEARQEFLQGIDFPSWDFPDRLRGLIIDTPTQTVIGICRWGDGTPMVPGLALGDRLLAVGDRRLAPGEAAYPQGDEAVEFRWERPDGTEFSTWLAKQPGLPGVR
jgi:hypothetical protein